PTLFISIRCVMPTHTFNPLFFHSNQIYMYRHSLFGFLQRLSPQPWREGDPLQFFSLSLSTPDIELGIWIYDSGGIFTCYIRRQNHSESEDEWNSIPMYLFYLYAALSPLRLHDCDR